MVPLLAALPGVVAVALGGSRWWALPAPTADSRFRPYAPRLVETFQHRDGATGVTRGET